MQLINYFDAPETDQNLHYLAEFGRLYSDYNPGLPRSPTVDARPGIQEDLVSDSFMAFWEERTQSAARCERPAYVLTIVKNSA